MYSARKIGVKVDQRIGVKFMQIRFTTPILGDAFWADNVAKCVVFEMFYSDVCSIYSDFLVHIYSDFRAEYIVKIGEIVQKSWSKQRDFDRPRCVYFRVALTPIFWAQNLVKIG